MRTISDSVLPSDRESAAPTDTALTQKTAETEPEPMKYPVKVKHRGQVLAKIYKPSKAYPLYRVCWRIHGQRRMKAFPTYSAAKKYADKLVEDLHKGSQVTALTPAQATDALAAFERLRDYYQRTGKRFSLLGGISELIDAAIKLNGRTVGEAVDGFLAGAASVERKDVGEAVDAFIKEQEPLTKASDGQRPEVSPKYHYNRAIMLRRFAGAFPNTAVCELGKGHLDQFMRGLGEMRNKSRNHMRAISAKARNHHRAAIRQFLAWAIRKDFLSPTHRLLEATAMTPQRANGAEVKFYTPAEFGALLEAASGPMRALIAIGGLAGLRTAELLRLTWEDTKRVENHIEITSGKAKTRQRRLVEIVPALAQWLAQFNDFTGLIWTGHEITFQQHFVAVCETARVEVKGKKIAVIRKPNGLRHSFCTFHLAKHGNENATALQAGHSPQMLFNHYRGLAQKKEGELWFDVSPEHVANVVLLVHGEA
jgi:integrase